MSIEQSTKGRDLDRALLQKLRDTDEVLGSSDPQCICNDMLGTQHSSFHGAIDLDVLGLRKRLRVQRTRDWQELHRPSVDDDPLLSMLIVTFCFQV
jgi:hypothetical protein